MRSKYSPGLVVMAGVGALLFVSALPAKAHGYSED
jgi:hypothetical protein